MKDDSDRIGWRRIDQTAVLRAWAIAEATSTTDQRDQKIAALETVQVGIVDGSVLQDFLAQARVQTHGILLPSSTR